MNWEDSLFGELRRAPAQESSGSSQPHRSLGACADRGVPRTHYCGILRDRDAGESVVLAGWVARRRDLGGLIFVDLRDRTGVVQVVFDPSENPAAHAAAGRLRAEYVVAVSGRVALREPGSRNSALPTGDVEIRPHEIEVLNESETPPFYLTDESAADETLRLRYRYLDLRRPAQSRNFALRHRISQVVRRYFDRHDFLEIETPSLTRSTPEGARDFLVPSRLSRGEFYALPQSPQLFKQLLMVAGFDRYFQIARCFRDEDLRADRQPEFTQVDVEMSFVSEEQVMSITEGLMLEILERSDTRLARVPFPRIKYSEAMARYGSDRPDMRFGMELQDLAGFAVAGPTPMPAFAGALASGGEVRAMVVPGGAGTSRKSLDGYAAETARFGVTGLSFVHFEPSGPRTPLSRFYGDDLLENWRAGLGASVGDLLVIGAGAKDKVRAALGHLRLYIARERELIPAHELAFVWVTEFPLMEVNEHEGRLVAVHHPFTAVHPGDLELLATDPTRARARAYDLVLNGVELGGGSIRNHRRGQQMRIFELLDMTPSEAEQRFGFLLEALDYGAPPHGGIALGLDRMVMMLAGLDSIRDCIAFPKTSSGTCLLTGAPAPVAPAQLAELGLERRAQEEQKPS